MERGSSPEMVTDAQVRLLRQKLMTGKTMEAAAAAAGMSERTARAWKTGRLPSQTKRKRDWRTRKDPFEDVWESEVLPLLRQDEEGALEATTILDELTRRFPGRFEACHLRTLQRRVRDWRAVHGPEREVFFAQEHEPGRQAAYDFTCCNELRVTIGGEPFPHLLFHLLLTFSRWRAVTLAFSETFEALLHGLQDTLARLGGLPLELRSDNLSAATRELKSGGRSLTKRYRDFLDHYGLLSSRIRPGKSNENGSVEKGHDVLKGKLEQALLLRGSRDFPSRDVYLSFVQHVVDQLNDRNAARFEQEKALLRPLPDQRLPAYTEFSCVVRSWSTIHFAKRTYSVPSRLIGSSVTVRQHAEHVEVFYKGKLVEAMPRIRGERSFRIDYRHVIWLLVRKPAAFARYRYREEMFPSAVFRRAFDHLIAQNEDKATLTYLRILHLAASTLQTDVELALSILLDQEALLDIDSVKALASPAAPVAPDMAPLKPDPHAFDVLLTAGGAS